MLSQRTFNIVVGVLFAVVSLLHLVRSILDWPVIMNEWMVPVGASVIGFLVAGFLAYSAFRLTRP